MWNVQVLPSSDSLYEAARSGSSVLSGPMRIRPLNTRPTSERSARLRAESGVTDSGLPTTPSRYTTRGGIDGDAVASAIAIWGMDRGRSDRTPPSTTSATTRAPTIA
jgi:hypothetical protein